MSTEVGAGFPVTFMEFSAGVAFVRVYITSYIVIVELLSSGAVQDTQALPGSDDELTP